MDLNKTERLSVGDEDILTEELSLELKLAEVDYREKKRLKGEVVDRDKMRNALNQRKKVKQLGDKLLGSILGKGVDLLKEAKNEVSSHSSHD